MSVTPRAFAALRTALVLGLIALGVGPSLAQQNDQPPAVGVVTVVRRPVTRSSEYLGRIQAQQRVNIVARVAAFLDKRFFTEGAEVKEGDLLYRLEQGPFQADIAAKQAAVTQFKAQLQNAKVVLERAKKLLTGPAGLQSAVDAALANQLSLEAQVQGAEAQLQTAQINLAYTEIHSPISGKIGRTTVTPGNYVSPGSGVLASIVTVDPMYVVFPMSTRAALDLRHQDASVVIKLRLPDGRIYDQTGTLDFVDNTIGGTTDTIALRGTIPNPVLPRSGIGIPRELVDGELVTVILQDAEPIEVPSVPMAAILSDQEGNYVFVVDAKNIAEVRRVKLGQSTPAIATVVSGLSEGESVIVEGIQRVRPGKPVAPGPASEDAFPLSETSPAASTGSAPAPRT